MARCNSTDTRWPWEGICTWYFWSGPLSTTPQVPVTHPRLARSQSRSLLRDVHTKGDWDVAPGRVGEGSPLRRDVSQCGERRS